jgi:hypothetical protein
MLRPNEIKKVLGRPVVQIFVDSGDLFVSLESNGPKHFIDNPGAGCASFMYFCRALGDVRSAQVFDDDWNIPKGDWREKGFQCIDVKRDVGGDSRVISLFTLRVHEEAVKARGLTTFVIVAGGADYTELLQSIKSLGVRVVVIGVEKDMSRSMIQSADVWAPVHEIVRDTRDLTDVARGYDWCDFVKLIHSLENSKLNFVGVKYLMRQILPSIGVSDPSQAHNMVEKAETLGIIEMYQETNSKGKGHSPVKALKLIRTNQIVLEVLGDVEGGA